jgi:hypothetical protein
MADTVHIAMSNVSRKFIAASQWAPQALTSQRCAEVDPPATYFNDIVVTTQHRLSLASAAGEIAAVVRDPAEEHIAPLRQQAKPRQRQCPEATASPLEGLEEASTRNRLSCPLPCPAVTTTNVIGNANGAVRKLTPCVASLSRCRTALPSTAAGFVAAEKTFTGAQSLSRSMGA